MKTKIFSFLVGLLIAVASFGQSSGTIGTLTWYFDGGGTLTISGSGAMPDYSSPWYFYRSSIQNVIIGEGVTSIGDHAFSECSSLTSIAIPESVTSIGDCTFRSCSKLTSITILNGVTSIGPHAFSECSSLTSITIPSSVTTIKYCAFEGCSKLTELNFNADSCSVDSPIWTNLKTINIGSNVRHIPSNAFSGCSGITSINIPSSITSIGELAFRDCHTLTSITIPESVTSIGQQAFYNCSKLTSITILNGVTSIGRYAFCKCNSLTSITIPSSVTSIGEGAFSGGGFTSITIPAGVTSIGAGAFSNSKLTSINVENGNVNYSSLNGVLFNKDKTTLISYPNGKTGDCIIPSYVIHIGDDAFAYYKASSITLPESLKTIGSHTFYECINLQSIVIPDEVTSVGAGAFENCSNLTYASVGNKVFTIGDYAFSGCYKLVSISLGESLNSIGSHVFGYYSSQLRNIYCYGKVAANCTFDSFSYDNYFDIYRNVRLHYPANASGYTTSPVWREFENRFYLDVEEREVKVKPSTNNTQQLSIPPVSGAAAYDLVIYANASRTDVVCTISFDAEGRLTGIMLRGGDDMPFSCTVNGLKGGTTYHYTMTAYNSDQEIIEQKMGSFKTEGEGTGVVGALHATPLPEIIGYYTLLGQKLPQEPQRGIYIILYDNGKSEKIMKYKE